MNNLSLRLSCIASLVPFGARVCDVGTDHGYLAIELLRSGKAKSVIATDINQKPLNNAQSNINTSGVKGIDLRLCDGLCGVDVSETDTVIIAGMGGEVISGIIERGSEITQNSGVTLILQPTTSPEFLRRHLANNGYNIIKEIPVSENGKHYSVMLVRFTGKKSKPCEFYYFVGKITPETRAGLLYIEKQQKRFLKCMTALENNPKKAEEYQHFHKLYNDITNYLNSFTE